MNLVLKRTPGIYLVGFMASGKTTVGRHLARRMGWNFFDLDSEIEAAEKAAISEIFAARGEPEFRRLESDMLARHLHWIAQGRPAILALGGGAFACEDNRALLAGNGVTVWLDCPFEVVSRRVAAQPHPGVRPLARDPERFASLYQARLASYRLADVHIFHPGDDPEAAVEAILQHPALQ